MVSLFGPPPPSQTPAQLYGLTEWGYAAEPILQEIGRWAAASPLHDPTLPLSPVSFMLSLRTMLDRAAARGTTLVTVFEIGTAQFTARLDDGAMPVERGAAERPDLCFKAQAAPPLAAAFYGDVAPEATGVEVFGDAAQCRDFHRALQPSRSLTRTLPAFDREQTAKAGRLIELASVKSASAPQSAGAIG